MAAPPTLADFGHDSMTQNGRHANGKRPLLVVLIEYENFPPFSTVHAEEYYEDLAFGRPVPPFTTDDPTNPGSLAAFFLENSYGRFTFDRVAVVGPLRMGALNDPGPEARTARVLTAVATRSPELFVGLDSDHDRTVQFDELCVLMFENITDSQPANRDNNPVVIQVPSGGGPVDVSLRVHFAGAGPLTPFYQIAHELSHSLGTVDLYNVGQGNEALTLMSRYPFFSNDQVSVHLDAWHKLALGWIEPRAFALDTAGSAVVEDGPAGAILLWDRSRREREYLLVERRRPVAPGVLYDGGVAGDGVCVWRVQVDMGFAAHLGAPFLTVGGSGVWTAGTQTPVLGWSDGATSGMHLSFSALDNGAVEVSWASEDRDLPSVVWHNSDTNETQLWIMNGGRVTGRNTVLGENGEAAFVGPPWNIVGVHSW